MKKLALLLTIYEIMPTSGNIFLDVAHKRKCAFGLACVCDHAVFVGGRKKCMGDHKRSTHRLYTLNPYFF